jgi:hypothetical protein
MKKIICVLFSLGVLCTSAQNDSIDAVFDSFENFDPANNRTAEEFINHTFSGMDFGYMQTQLFYNKVVPYSNIHKFSGSATDSVMTSENFQQLYWELTHAAVNGLTLPDYFELDSVLNNYVEQHQAIPLLLIDFEYETIRLDAMDLGYLSYNQSTGVLSTTGTGNPFEKHRVIATMPYWTETPNNLPIVLEPNFIFGIDPATLSDVLINGKSVRNGEVMLYDFNTTTIANVQTINEQRNTNISYQPQNFQLKSSGFAEDPTHTFLNIISNGSLGIWQGCNTFGFEEIKKPVLIVEGFDPFNTRVLSSTDQQKLPKESQRNDPENHLYYVANDEGLADSLRQHGYDIIILNFTNGSADMFVNAKAVRDAITWINSVKTTDNELIIIGPSMGGVLARYALAFMEKNNIEHKTKLFVSLDAPHQGANVCLGLQHTINFVLNSLSGGILTLGLTDFFKEFRNSLINAPATKQMLLYHHSATSFSKSNANPHADHLLFYSFMKQLNPSNGGYPTKCRNIAIADGSSNATLQTGIENGENLLTWTLIMPPSPFVPYFEVYLRYNALPQHTYKSISQGILLAGLWIYPFLPTLVPVNVNYTHVNNTDPMDNAPAGTQTFHSDINSRLYGSCNLCTFKNDQNKDAFVPTKSALDLQNTTDWRYNFASGQAHRLVGPNNYYFPRGSGVTPFDEVYVNIKNDKHVIGSLDNISGAWVKGEISPYDLKLQNKTVTYNTKHEAKRTITTGRNVTNQIGVGDYKLSNNTHVDFVAGQEIRFEPGFSTNGGTMTTFVDNPTCNGSRPAYEGTLYQVTAGDENSNQPKSLLQIILDSEEKTKKISIFPNPTRGELTVNLPEGTYNLQLTDVTGKLVADFGSNTHTTQTLNVSHLENGMYFLKIYNHDTQHIERVVVQK